MSMSPHRWFLWTVLFLLAGPALVRAQSLEETQRTVSVSGEGTVYVVPDEATVRFGVVTRDDDPEEARRRNAEAAREAMNAVRALGVEERKLRMETLRLQPLREYDQDARRYRELGYEAIRILVVELDDLEMLPQLITEIVQKGANRLDGVAYDVSDRDAVRNEALQQAVQNAQEKAQLMAATVGGSLGRTLRLNEQNFSFPRPMMRTEMMEMAVSKADAAPEPEAYAAGEIEVNAMVQVVFELTDE